VSCSGIVHVVICHANDANRMSLVLDAVQIMGTFGFRATANILWAWARLGESRWMAVQAMALAACNLTRVHLSSLFVNADYCPGAHYIDGLLEAQRRRMRQADSQELSNSLWALAKLSERAEGDAFGRLNSA
jgi:hypothetical protein